MRKEDLDEVANIIASHESFDGICARRYYEGYFNDSNRIASDWERNFVALAENNTVVGVCGFSPDHYGTPMILWLTLYYVDRVYQKRGVGKLLLHHVLTIAKILGVKKVYLDTSSDDIYSRAVKVYKSVGFWIEGELLDHYEPGENMVIMGIDMKEYINT